jgi:hypothetical protein
MEASNEAQCILAMLAGSMVGACVAHVMWLVMDWWGQSK